MTDNELEILLERAAKRGAEKALKEVGLSDDDAVHDIKEMRDLLEAFRDMRRTVVVTFAKMVTTFVVGLLAFGSYMKWGG
jgi:hypothetical protein